LAERSVALSSKPMTRGKVDPQLPRTQIALADLYDRIVTVWGIHRNCAGWPVILHTC
jgi:hypothetical protein